MADEFNTGAPSTGAAPTSTPQVSGTPTGGQPNASGSPAGSAPTIPAGTTGAPTAQVHTIIVDGKPMQVGLDDLIVRAQKGTAAEKRFEEAARVRKEAEQYVQAVNELKEIVSKKDYNKFKEIVGEDFFSGLSGNKAQNPAQPSYSVEDMRTAEALGVDVTTYVDAKMKAMGIDNPMVAKQAQEIQALKEQLSKVNEYMHSVKIENDAARIETQFRSIAEKYPDVDPNRVLDIVEREKRSASDFENIFKTLNDLETKKLEAKYNEYMEKKKKESMGNFGGVNYSAQQPDRDVFKGKTLSERREILKGMFK